MALVIQFKAGSRFSGSAEKAHAETEKIRRRDGNITPQAVVEAARDEANPLHRHIFDCKPATAAKRYYEENARKLIRSIECIHVAAKRGGGDIVAPVYTNVSLSKPDEKPVNVYDSLEDMLKDPAMRAQVLARAIRELASFRRKYADLQELSQVYEALDSVLLALEA